LSKSERMRCTSQGPIGAMSIRPLQQRDVRVLRDHFASGISAQTTRWAFPRSLPSMLGWFDDVGKSRAYHGFAIVVDGQVVGTCSLRPPRYAGKELAIAIFDPAMRGRGVGTFAVTEVCRFGFVNLRLDRIELGVYPTHRQAIGCYARCGFQYEALIRNYIYHNGVWRDLMWMSLLRSDAREAWKKTERARRGARS
jgi:RimJ/RimL family protein N-acetyltransferase